MKRLENFKKIADELLEDVHVTDEVKSKIHMAVLAPHKNHNVVRIYRSAVSLAVAACLIFSIVALNHYTPFDNNNRSPENAATSDITSNKMSENDRSFELSALKQTDAGIPSDATFLLKTNDLLLTVDELRPMLEISNVSDIDIEAGVGGEFYIKANEHFKNNSIINVSLSSNEGNAIKTWAFQTETSFSINSTLPSDLSAGMTLDSGIEINFTGYVTKNLEKYFKITPQTEGHFEYYRKTAAFIPDKPLLEGTVYTVKISAGLTSENGQILDNDYSFSFKTPYNSYDGKEIYLNSGITESFLKGDAAVIELSADTDYDFGDFKVDIYKLKDIRQYIELADEITSATHPSLDRAGEYLTDTANLSLYTTFDTALMRSNGYYGPAFIVIPNELPYGWYLTEISQKAEGGKKIQKLIQISDTSVYLFSVGSKALAWVNNADGSPANTKVTLNVGPGVYESTTDITGLASFDGINIDDSYVTVQAGDDFADAVFMNRTDNTNASTDFYTMVYRDREAYLPTDTVKLWGNIFPKEHAKLPSEVQLEVGYSDMPEAVYTVNVNANGSFSYEIPLKRHISGYVDYRIVSNDKILYSSTINIMEYTKPVYSLTAELDKPYYQKNEIPKATVKASFYDGTPASNLNIRYYPENSDKSVDKNLDKNGKAMFDVAVPNAKDSWMPQFNQASFVIAGAEDVTTYAYAYYTYFPTDYMLTSKNIGNGQLELSANKINYNNFKKGEFYPDADMLRGEISDTSGTIDIIKCEYVEKFIGNTYDFINKVNVPQYEYDYKEVNVLSENFSTSNGKYITKPVDLNKYPSAWYRCDVQYTSEDGVKLEEKFFLNSYYYDRYQTKKVYNYTPVNKNSVKINENIEMSLTSLDGSKIESGRMLNIVTANDIVKSSITKAGRFSASYDKEMVPNAYISGAYFDGKHVYKIDTTEVSLDTSNLQLLIDTSVSGDKFKPGDDVHVDITVKNHDGKPVKSNFAVSVTDNAAFAIMEQSYKPLDNLYLRRYLPYPNIYTSYTEHNFNQRVFAEGGGEGENNSVRENFVDNAAFISGTTDANGKASVTFKLPDDLTSWRVTTVATSSGSVIPCAGVDTANITTSLDYFISPIINKTFVSGDDIVFSLRSSGIEAKGESTYEVEISKLNSLGKNDIVKKLKASSADSAFAYVNAGKLSDGAYSVTIKAKNGKYSDAIMKDFEVIASNHEFSIKKSVDLSKDLELSAARYPFSLLCYSSEMSKYMDILTSLYIMNGKRADQKLAVAISSDLLSEIDSSYFAANDDDLDIQELGGVRLTSYSKENANLTAKSMICAGEYVNLPNAKKFLYEVIYDKTSSKQDVYSAYMGLASLKEPVLNDITLLLRNDTSDTENLIYLYTGLALIGNSEQCNAWFNANCRNLPALSEKNIDFYANAALLSMVLNRSESEEMIDKLLEFESKTYLPAFEFMYYVTHKKIENISNTTLTVTHGSDTKTYPLSEKPLTLTLNDTKDLTFALNGGKAAATALYVGKTEDISDTLSDKVTLTKTYEPIGDGFSVGNTVRVTVNVKLKDDSIGESNFTLSDIVPSGMRFVKAEYNYGLGWWLSSAEDNRLTFTIAPDLNNSDSGNKQTDTFSIVYYARCVLSGEFVSEPCILSQYETGKTTISDSKVVNIK